MSEARFRMLADNMAQLAWTCDDFGNVTWYNQQWLDYTGMNFEDMQGCVHRRLSCVADGARKKHARISAQSETPAHCADWQSQFQSLRAVARR